MVKAKDYMKMGFEALNEELGKKRETLMEERVKLKVGTKDDKKNNIRALKKDISRILTVISEKKKEELKKELKKKGEVKK